jgi:hypothetical protein
MGLIYALFYDIRQPRLVITVVSGQPVGPILKGQGVQKSPQKMEFVFILLTYFCLHQASSTSYVLRAT